MTDTELELLKLSGMILLAFIGIFGGIIQWIAKPYFDSRIENIRNDNQIKIDKIIRDSSQKDREYNELKLLYIKINEMIEEAIKATKNHDTSNLNSQFSKLTAEIRMIASNKVIEKYLLEADLFHNWANVYIKAFPKPVNGFHIMYSSGSDPTLKYKELEKDAYDDFYNGYEDLIKDMRLELKSNI
jgi:hypothetical protein